MIRGDKFTQHLKRSSKIVASWPEWKQVVLGGVIKKQEKDIMAMTDAETRAELGRINPALEMDFVMSEEESPHRFALRLLAESQRALRKIDEKITPLINRLPSNSEIVAFVRIQKIAQNACKKGSNATR